MRGVGKSPAQQFATVGHDTEGGGAGEEGGDIQGQPAGCPHLVNMESAPLRLTSVYIADAIVASGVLP